MKNIATILGLIILMISLCNANAPDWVKNNGFSDKYPPNQYMTGYGIAGGADRADRRVMAAQNARTALSSKFQTRIRSDIITEEAESEGDYYAQVKSTINAKSNLTLLGTDVYHYDDEQHTYALAVLEITPAIHNYTKRLAEIQATIKDYLKNAQEAEEAEHLKSAITYYRLCFPLFIELGETRTILNILNGRNPFQEFKQLDGQFTVTLPEIDQHIQQLLASKITSLEDAAYIVAEQLSESLEKDKILLRVFPFTYQQTDFGSEFSAYLKAQLVAQLADDFRIVNEDSPQAYQAALLTGTYRVTDQQCHIQALLNDPENGAVLSAATLAIDKSIIEQSGIALMPRNFQQAMQDSRVFYSSDVLSGKLALDAWTNKGGRNLIFQAGDESTLLVRVNKPCYLQCIYHLANGMRVLMYNNYYIDVSKVNMVVAMPDTFVVYPPFGVERWQIFASTAQFPKVPVKGSSIAGEYYDNVLAEDLQQYTATTRGLKKKKSKTEMTEETITITTIKKN